MLKYQNWYMHIYLRYYTYAFFFNLQFTIFFVKKRAKGEISDRFSGKTQYNRASIFTKRNGFLC